MSVDAQLQAGAEAVNGPTCQSVKDSTPAMLAGAGRPPSTCPPNVRAAIDRARRESNRIATGARLVSGVNRLVAQWGFRTADGRSIVIALRLEKIRRALHYAGSPLAQDCPAIRRLADSRGRWELLVQDVLERGFRRLQMEARHEIHPGLTRCRSCAAKVVWLDSKRRTRVIVDAETVEPEDTMYDPPRHRAHWATCPQAKDWRKPTSGTTRRDG